MCTRKWFGKHSFHHDRAICDGKCLRDPSAFVLSYSHAQLQCRSLMQSLIKLGEVWIGYAGLWIKSWDFSSEEDFYLVSEQCIHWRAWFLTVVIIGECFGFLLGSIIFKEEYCWNISKSFAYGTYQVTNCLLVWCQTKEHLLVLIKIVRCSSATC